MNKAICRSIARSLLRKHGVRSARSVHLAEALSMGKMIMIEDATVLCREGEDSDRMYVIARGTIQVMRQDSTGSPGEITSISGPTLIGQMGFIDGSRRSATCISDGKAVGIVFSLSVFQKLMRQQSLVGSAFRHQVMFTMMNQLSGTNQRINQLHSATA